MRAPFLPLLTKFYEPYAPDLAFDWYDPQWASIVQDVQRRLKQVKRVGIDLQPLTLPEDGHWTFRWAMEAHDWAQTDQALALSPLPSVVVAIPGTFLMMSAGTSCDFYRRLGIPATEIVLVRGISSYWDVMVDEIHRHLNAGIGSTLCEGAPIGERKRVAPILTTTLAIAAVEGLRFYLRR